MAEVRGGCKSGHGDIFACINPSGPPPPAPSPFVPAAAKDCDDSVCQALAASYGTLRNQTCASVIPHVPVPNAADVAAFMALYQKWNGTAAAESRLIAAAQKVLGSSPMKTFLSLPDTFQAGGLDAAMVKCAVMSQATPVGLAQFAVVSPAQKALVTKLLADPTLMRDMLVAGGPVFSENDKGNAGPKRYGVAMAIYEKLVDASDDLKRTLAMAPPASDGDSALPWDDRSQATILKRFALGLAMEHAVPIRLRYNDKDCDEAYDWCPSPPKDQNETFVDPVARYLHYEKAYKAGDLDPAFEVLTAFECKHTSNSPASDEDLAWVRQTMGNYRPDLIATGYEWRYARAAAKEVEYALSMCDKWSPEVCSGHYAEIPASSGKCGPRAFFGRFTRVAFGLPTWGATQERHAAMTTWSPNRGWYVLLGAAWPYCFWGHRSGPDFVLETQARELRPEFQQILRGGWVAQALGEVPAGKNWGRGNTGYGGGGPWSALMLYAKKIAVASAPAVPRVVGPAVVPSKISALIAKWPAKLPAPEVTTGADGTITIPAAAFTSKNRSASLTVMKSNIGDEGEQVFNGGCRSSLGPPCKTPTSSSWHYTFSVASAGTYFLAANFTTWHMDQDLIVTANGGPPAVVPVFYTVGWWNQTQPVPVKLTAGNNTLLFYRTTGRPLVFKAFNLYRSKPAIPQHPAAYTPSPAPKYPNASQYIEVPASTNCVQQGIMPMPEEDCSRACLALGFKYTGTRSRPNISGCFVLTETSIAGNCNFNLNKSATCTPPCQLYNSTVRSLCLRA